jgi:hypothetical protein
VVLNARIVGEHRGVEALSSIDVLAGRLEQGADQLRVDELGQTQHVDRTGPQPPGERVVEIVVHPAAPVQRLLTAPRDTVRQVAGGRLP